MIVKTAGGLLNSCANNMEGEKMYKLQFIQEFQEGYANEFLELETLFAKLEKEEGFSVGKRYVGCIGPTSENTFIWESEFETIEEAISALKKIKGNDKHEDLFQKQNKYFVKSYVNILRSVCEE